MNVSQRECIAQQWYCTWHYDFISSFKMTYLCPNGAFNLEAFVKQLQQFHELLITVLKAMTKNQGADDIGDNVVDDAVWIEWLTSNIKQKIRCKLCILCHCEFTIYLYSY